MTTSHRREKKMLLSQCDVDKAFQFLHQEQYEHLADFLVDFQRNPHNSNSAELLTTLYYLALTCHVLNKSAIWHQQVGEQSFAQMEEIVMVLREFLQMLRDGNCEMLAHQSGCTLQSANGQHSLWQRVKNLFQSNEVHLTDTIQPPVLTPVNTYLSNHDRPQPTAKSVEKVVSTSDTIQPDKEHTLLIYGLGVFCAYHQGKLISDWSTRKSKSVFKYLLLNREKPVPKEILMEVFWPDSDETAARNNLNVTIYNLRQVFGKIDSSMSYVLYQDDCYLLNPDLSIWFDYDVFREYYHNGCKLHKVSQLEDAVHEFQAAELVYRGELFEEDRYDDWLVPQREATHQQYLQVLEHLIQDAFAQQQYVECINLCHKLLTVDACLEDTHRLLIRCYIKQGQNHLAIRQYYTCVQTLEDELDVLPSQDTVALYEQIRTTIKE